MRERFVTKNKLRLQVGGVLKGTLHQPQKDSPSTESTVTQVFRMSPEGGGCCPTHGGPGRESSRIGIANEALLNKNSTNVLFFTLETCDNCGTPE